MGQGPTDPAALQIAAHNGVVAQRPRLAVHVAHHHEVDVLRPAVHADGMAAHDARQQRVARRW